MSLLNHAEYVSKFDLFHGLPADDVKELLAECVEVVLQPGDPVLMIDGEARELWLLMHGWVDVEFTLADQTKRPVVSLGPGSLLGEVSFLRPAKHTANLKCVSACVFARLDRARFDLLIERKSTAALRLLMKIAETMAARLQVTDELLKTALGAVADGEFHKRTDELRHAFLHRSEASLVFLGLNPM